MIFGTEAFVTVTMDPMSTASSSFVPGLEVAPNPPGSARSRLVVGILLLAVLSSACSRGGNPQAGTPSSPSPTAGLSATSRVGLRNVGPVVVGMTIAELAKAAGVPLTRQPDFDQAVAQKNCAFMSPSTIPGYVPPPDSGNKSPLAFMIVDGKVARIDILGGSFSTAAGIKVGSSEQAVLAAYGNSSPLPPRPSIGPPYRYLTATPRQAADKNYRMVFESDGAKVVQFRVGQLPQVENKQGCTP